MVSAKVSVLLFLFVCCLFVVLFWVVVFFKLESE